MSTFLLSNIGQKEMIIGRQKESPNTLSEKPHLEQKKVSQVGTITVIKSMQMIRHVFQILNMIENYLYKYNM